MTTSENKKRTITLTDRAPVTIREDEWPLIASAKGDSYSGNDYGRYNQALQQGEVDQWSIRVRQHEDGRTLVYAVLDGASAWTGTQDRRGGELLEGDVNAERIVAAIKRVGEDVGIADATIRKCIADLPAEDLDAELDPATIPGWRGTLYAASVGADLTDEKRRILARLAAHEDQVLARVIDMLRD